MKLARVALFVCLAGVLGRSAEANPLLQLDMKNGVYDTVTQTIMSPAAGGGPFTLYALLQPKANWSQEEINYWLHETYYISAAITPSVGPVPASIGSFTFAGETVNATADMTYGTPPLEVFASRQGYENGDLPHEEPYPTYFQEFSFQFQPANRALAYNSALTPGGLTPSDTGGAYYAVFNGDTSLLGAGYDIHFDLYTSRVKACGELGGSACSDVMVDSYAAFTNDAQTQSVPEPMTAAGMLMGLATCFTLRRRSGIAGQNG